MIRPGSLILFKGGNLTAELKDAEMNFMPADIDVIPVTMKGTASRELVSKQLVIVRP